MEKIFQVLICLSVLFCSTHSRESKSLLFLSDDAAILDGGKVATECMKQLMNNIPPAFCWKKGADFGVIPTRCPEGTFRSLALCYDFCSNGFKHDAGVCWEICPDGYSNGGLICFKSAFHWYFKHSYIPTSYTNFSDKVLCDEGYYKDGALCYKNCNNIGLENCGIGACSSDFDSCLSELKKMIFEVIDGIAKLVKFAMSAGSSSAVEEAKSAVFGGISKVGKETMKYVVKSLANTLTGKFKNLIRLKAIKSVEEKRSELGLDSFPDFSVPQFCNHVFEHATNKTIETQEIDTVLIPKALDIFGVQGIVETCLEALDWRCAKEIVDKLKNYDPTGLLTIAHAFIYPICDVMAPDHKIDTDLSIAISLINSVKDKCALIYDGCNFKGNFKQVCEDENLTNLQNVKSIITSHDAYFIFFEKENFQGKFFPVGRENIIPCVDDYTISEADASTNIKSLKIQADKCVVISSVSASCSDQITNNVICSDKNEFSLEIRNRTDLSMLSFSFFNEKLSLTLYEGSNYSGNSFELSSSRNIQSSEFNEFSIEKVSSLKIKLN